MILDSQGSIFSERIKRNMSCNTTQPNLEFELMPIALRAK